MIRTQSQNTKGGKTVASMPSTENTNIYINNTGTEVIEMAVTTMKNICTATAFINFRIPIRLKTRKMQLCKQKAFQPTRLITKKELYERQSTELTKNFQKHTIQVTTEHEFLIEKYGEL